MSKILKNCWLFFDDRSVWAVCQKCMEKKLSRDEYWVNVVPNTISTYEKLNAELNQKEEISVPCNSGIHKIPITRVWFARKGLKKPED